MRGGDVELGSGSAVAIPIEGELDLHTFNPKDVGVVLPEYVRACRERGILEIRVVHGKGQGIMQRTVHGLLARMEEVESFHLAGAEALGGWGATLVKLRAKGEEGSDGA